MDGLALESALWCRYCAGVTDSGATIEPNDPQWYRLSSLAAEAQDRPQAWLEMDAVYGDLGADARFAKRFVHWRDQLRDNGTATTLTAYIDGA